MAIGANLSKRDQMMVAVSVLSFALAGAYGYFMYMPKSDDLEAVQQHVDVLDKQNSQARAAIANGSLQKLRLEADQYATELTALRQIVPTTKTTWVSTRSKRPNCFLKTALRSSTSCSTC